MNYILYNHMLCYETVIPYSKPFVQLLLIIIFLEDYH